MVEMRTGPAPASAAGAELDSGVGSRGVSADVRAQQKTRPLKRIGSLRLLRLALCGAQDMPIGAVENGVGG